MIDMAWKAVSTLYPLARRFVPMPTFNGLMLKLNVLPAKAESADLSLFAVVDEITVERVLRVEVADKNAKHFQQSRPPQNVLKYLAYCTALRAEGRILLAPGGCGSVFDGLEFTSSNQMR